MYKQVYTSTLTQKYGPCGPHGRNKAEMQFPLTINSKKPIIFTEY